MYYVYNIYIFMFIPRLWLPITALSIYPHDPVTIDSILSESSMADSEPKLVNPAALLLLTRYERP